MINLPKDNNFINVFKEIFIDKKIIGFEINKDLINLPNDIMTHLQEKNEIIELINIYKIVKFETPIYFSDVCKELFGEPFCKIEEFSDWERRPLRQSQLHYAALNAIYCCLVFKKLFELKDKFK